jgi:endonuclease V-like protein UPF0215 family
MRRPHLFGVDDGPHEKRQRAPVPIVGAMMEAGDLLEAVAVTSFPVDGDGATEALSAWVRGLRFHASLHAILLGGITIAGLGVVDIEALSAAVGRPVLVVTRKDPSLHRLARAFKAAGLEERMAVVERTPPAVRTPWGVWLAHVGVPRSRAEQLLGSTLRKSKFPEPLRVAHLVAQALVRGQSRGRV